MHRSHLFLQTATLCAALCANISGLVAADIDFTSPHANYVSGTGPRTVAIGRLDNNASNDLVVGNGGGDSIRVFLNNGNGTFPVPAPALAVVDNPSSVAIADLSGDGKNDVVVSNQGTTSGQISVFLGIGDGTFQTRQDFTAAGSVVAMRVVDLNGDGKLDVLAAGVGLEVFLGNGVGGFIGSYRPLTSGFVNSVTVGDLDNDGLLDIACTASGQLTTLFCTSSGTPGAPGPVYTAPVAHPTGADNLSVAMGDFNGDGLKDLAETHYYGPTYAIAVLLNQGSRTFGAPTTFATGRQPKALMAEDMDGDAKLDLLCVNVSSQTVGILRGKGDGTFHPHIGYLTGAGPYVEAVGDLDGNGSPDVAAANISATTMTVLLQGTGAAPGAVTNLAADALPSDQYARLSWTTPLVESYGPLTRYDLRLRVGGMTAGQFASATPVLPGPVVAPSGSAASFVLSGLAPNTTYGAAMTVTDAFGRTSVLSNIATFTTSASDTTAPGQPSPYSVAYGTSNSTSYCVLRWTAPGDDGTLGTATSYNLRMSTTDITDATTFANATPIATAAPQLAGTQEELIVNGLVAGSTHYLAMTATDEAGNVSTRSTTLIVIPPATDSILPGRITNLAVVATTAHSITLRWTAKGDDGLYGQATSYDVRWADRAMNDAIYQTLGVPVTGEPVPGIAGTVHELVINGLTDQTLYYFALTVSDEVPNTTTISNLVSATTADGTAPAAIAALAIAAPTTTSLALTWTAPGDDGASGTATSYDVRYSTTPITTTMAFDGATTATGEPAPQLAGTVEHFTLTGLTPGTTYYIAIRTSDEVPNTSALANAASGTTTAAPGGSGTGGGSSGGGGGCGLGGGLAALLLAVAGMLLLNVTRGSRSFHG